ncbi:MAG: putative toxin-antitoxin system toxin component, PIN family [Anaerolineae bacterium]|nr:putative toxin-antitoxin system toxin component, PIN family [Anaerolineae bacterium]
MISVVIDNNVFVSAFLRGGKPLEVLNLVGRGYVQLISTEAIMDQLRAVLLRPKFRPDFEARGQDIEEIVRRYMKLARYVTPLIIPEKIVRDDEDKQFVECALGGKADYLVSGDKDLTSLGVFRGLPIVTPAQFLAILTPPAEVPSDDTQSE